MENQILDNNTETTATNVNYAGFWIRTGASIIDLVAYSPLIALSMYNLYILKNLPLQLLVTLLMSLYKPLMEYKYSATLGKMAVKIKVVDEKFDNISLLQAVLRYSPWIVSQAFSWITTILLFQHPDFMETTGMAAVGQLQSSLMPPYYSLSASAFLLIAILVVVFNAKKQGLHDLIAKTYVVYK